MSILIIFLSILACARITRLMTTDLIFEPVRLRIESYSVADRKRTNRFAGWVTQLLSCDWCSSVWAAALVVGLACSLPHSLFIWPALALSASYIVGYLSVIENWFEDFHGHDH